MRRKAWIATQGRIPDAIYNIRPYFYICVGAHAIFLAKNGMAVFSGIILITAGFLVWIARYQFRRDSQRSSQHIVEDKIVITETGDNTMSIRWLKSFESGHAVLDNQHHKLFVLGNELMNKVVNNRPKSEILSLLEEIIRLTNEHFSSEEVVLDAIKHPVSESHKGIRTSMLSKLNKYYDLFKKGPLFQKDLIGFIVYDLITYQLMNEDVQYFEGVKKRLNQA